MVAATVAKLKTAKVARDRAKAAEERRQKSKASWEAAQTAAQQLASTYDKAKKAARSQMSELMQKHPEALQDLPEKFAEDHESGSDWEIEAYLAPTA
jgi:hypothetical protein